MKKLIAVLSVLVLLVIGLGFYRGWFVLSSQRTDVEGKQSSVDVNLSIDPNKAKEDAQAVETRARALTGDTADDPPRNSSPDGVKSNN